MKILVVDDEYAFCKSLKEYLVALGHKVLVATNGEHGIDLIREENPDLMTLDMRMPGVNGLEVLAKMRQENRPVKIIVITAVDAPMMEKNLTEAGAAAVIRKPVDLVELTKIISKLSS